MAVRTLPGDPPLTYHLYVSHRGGQGAPLFIDVHGNGRGVAQHASLFAPFAERAGAVLLAPLFPADHFPDFQRLGRAGRGARADLALQRLVAEVGALTGARTDKLHLSGYSGGAQFVHRYTMAYPEQVARFVAGAAGWYTFPDPAVEFPGGIRSILDLPDVVFVPERFLRVPGCVFVGEDDVQRDTDLNQRPEVDAQQGLNRVERGKRWVEAMQAAAAARGLRTPYAFQLLPRSPHSFSQCMRNGGLGDKTVGCLGLSR
ncbi:MAG: hypothetical protein ACT4PY_10840 [Armatimonadota bacterium]